MKIAILSESPADEAAGRILVRAILGPEASFAAVHNRRAPGWTGIVEALAVVLRSQYFNSDADGVYIDGLVTIIDSNGTSIHEREHDIARADTGCRFCQLRKLADTELSRLTQLPDRPKLRCAIGLAVPAIEAWLLSRTHPGMNEATWKSARQERPPREPYSRAQLKALAYGTSKPTLEQATRKMEEYMSAAARNLEGIKGAFPGGFGPLHDELQSWK